jgi:hypothetical protein
VLGLFVPAALAFALVERRLELAGRHPIVPPSLLRLPGMRSGLLIAIPFFAGFGAFMFVCAIALQHGAGFSALRAGIALVPMASTFLVASLYTARLTARYGRLVLGAGAVIQGIGLVALAVTLLVVWPAIEPWNLAPAMAVAGFGQGLVLSPLFGLVLSGVPADRAGVGSGVLSTTQQSALALGVASLGSLFLSLSTPGSLGTRDAFVVVLAVQTSVAVLVAVASRLLPQPSLAQRARADEAVAELGAAVEQAA